MTSHHVRGPASRLVRDWALDPRAAGRLAGLADAGVLAAAFAAFPAWAALAVAAGPRLAAPAGLRAWVSLVLIAPLLEELLFRGVIQGELLRWTRRRSIGPITVANLVSTATFAALHLRWQPPDWALAIAVPSLVLGLVRDRLRSVWPGVLLHGWYNAGFALAAVWARGAS